MNYYTTLFDPIERRIAINICRLMYVSGQAFFECGIGYQVRQLVFALPLVPPLSISRITTCLAALEHLQTNRPHPHALELILRFDRVYPSENFHRTMADPVGIIGTAVGLVSFGLQLYTTINEYVRAIEGRDDELASASQTADRIATQVQSIVDTLAKLPVLADYHGHTTEISSALQEWQIEKQSLVDILDKLQPKPGAWRKAKAKALYPFNRKGLVEVRGRLRSLINRLSLALQVLDMLVFCLLSLPQSQQAPYPLLPFAIN